MEDHDSSYAWRIEASAVGPVAEKGAVSSTLGKCSPISAGGHVCAVWCTLSLFRDTRTPLALAWLSESVRNSGRSTSRYVVGTASRISPQEAAVTMAIARLAVPFPSAVTRALAIVAGVGVADRPRVNDKEDALERARFDDDEVDIVTATGEDNKQSRMGW